MKDKNPLSKKIDHNFTKINGNPFSVVEIGRGIDSMISFYDGKGDVEIDKNALPLPLGWIRDGGFGFELIEIDDMLSFALVELKRLRLIGTDDELTKASHDAVIESKLTPFLKNFEGFEDVERAPFTHLALALHREADIFTSSWYAARVAASILELGLLDEAAIIYKKWQLNEKSKDVYLAGVRFQEAQEERAKKGGGKSTQKREQRKTKIREIISEARQTCPWEIEGNSAVEYLYMKISKSGGALFQHGGRLLSRHTVVELWDDARADERAESILKQRLSTKNA